MSNKKFNLSLFIFRRDLRLNDNTGLINALENSKLVIPCFIINKEQISSKNKYKSNNAIQFMFESLVDLNNQLKKKDAYLYLFYGYNLNIIKNIIENLKIEAIYVNRDYTPYSKKRDDKIEKLCIKNSIKFIKSNDSLINEPEVIKNNIGKPYLIFSKFYKKCININVKKPVNNNYKNYFKSTIAFSKDISILESLIKYSNSINQNGGRNECKKILNNLDNFKDYKNKRDFLSYQTTQLSAHNKFGNYSIREVYFAIENKFGKTHELIRSLYWRDFFTHIAWHYPEVFKFSYKEKYRDINWSKNKQFFKLWCKGKTGFPIVDAGIRQLNKTGFMHNRARLITASFLVKDLHINWQWGEKYFAQNLIDYDPAVNNGNWQWVASTGLDSSPYFRVFNPWIQQKKFDPNCVYIKKWVPELKNIENKIIHNWHKEYQNKKIKIKYPEPIIDHKKEILATKELYKNKII